MTDDKYARFKRFYDFDLASYTAPTDVQIFTTPGNATWIKPANADTVTVYCIGGAGGGGSGARQPSGTATCGGAGAPGAGFSTNTFRAADLNGTEAVVVGAGGAGGAAVTTDSTNGNPGIGGGSSRFGSPAKVAANASGGAGGGGTSVPGVPGPGAGTSFGGAAGGQTIGQTGAGMSSRGGHGGSSGGGGGGINAAGTAFGGGTSGNAVQLGDSNAAGGAVGSNGVNGPAAPVNIVAGGGGGSGGGAATTTAAGKGGDGGRYGAGGGGGGSSLNGFNSGAGGKGSDGIVVVFTKCLSTATTFDGPVQQPKTSSGTYYFTASPATSGTTNALGVNNLRVYPWIVTETVTLVKIGAEVVAAGDAGSKFRMGIYVDDGNGRPGARVYDAGQIAGDVVGSQDLTINVTLPPNIYWIGGVVQSVTTNQPTMRTIGGAWHPPIAVSAGTTTPGVAATVLGCSLPGVTGALPAPFGSAFGAGVAARIFIKTA